MAVQRYEETREIPGVSPEQVFAFVEDVDNVPRFVDAVVEARAEGGPGIGMQIHSVSSMMGLKIKGTQQVQHHEPPTRYRYGGTDPFPSSFEFLLEAAGDGTRMTLVAEIEPKGLPGGGLVVGRFIKKQIKEMADNIVAMVSE
jgi:carbon monoxide dehydrogenase subunit G